MTNQISDLPNSPENPTEHRPTPKPLQILLVEDNPADAELIKQFLGEVHEGKDFWLVHVKRLETGIKVLSKNVFDAVILDLSLPDSQGLETVQGLRKANPDLPIIVLTGLDDHQTGIQAIRYGAQEYLIKGSIDAESLSRVIRYAIERHRIFTHVELQNVTTLYSGDHDPVTDLPNRKLFYYRLDHALSRAQRNSKVIALLFLNIDDFRSVNSELGRSGGDALLKLLAQRMRGLLRESDTIARLWGDQFAIVLYGITSPQDAAVAAKKILRTVSEPVTLMGEDFSVTASMGISVYPTDSNDLETLITDANEAQQQAKQLGKAQFCFSSPVRNAKLKEAKDLEAGLNDALRKNEFEVHYQPHFEFATGELMGMEALLRWKQKNGEPIPAKDFISFSEKTDLILPIHEWTLRNVCEQMKPWIANKYLRGRVSINLSPQLLRSEAFFDSIRRITHETQFDTQYLAFEISETTALELPNETLTLIRNLKDLGIALFVDRYGTGSVSLSFLKKSRASLLKIDRSLLSQIPGDPNNSAIMTAIVKVAHSLNLKVIATGIESATQLQFARSLHCEGAQGFFLGRPKKIGEFLEVPSLSVPPEIPIVKG